MSSSSSLTPVRLVASRSPSAGVRVSAPGPLGHVSFSSLPAAVIAAFAPSSSSSMHEASLAVMGGPSQDVFMLSLSEDMCMQSRDDIAVQAPVCVSSPVIVSSRVCEKVPN